MDFKDIVDESGVIIRSRQAQEREAAIAADQKRHQKWTGTHDWDAKHHSTPRCSSCNEPSPVTLLVGAKRLCGDCYGATALVTEATDE